METVINQPIAGAQRVNGLDLCLRAMKRVLIVDDHRMVRTALAFSLRIFDDVMVVGEAANGRDALWLCDEVAPHVVLVDISMPEMDGLSMTKAIRKLYPQIKVIAMTSITTGLEQMHEIVQAGAVQCLPKQFSIDELVSAIRAIS